MSTQEQSASGLGLDAQQTTIEATASRLNVPLVQVYTDAAVSGAVPLEERPNLLAALDVLKTGDVLLVAKRDRLGRDVLNVAMIERLVERKGARIVSPDAPDASDPSSILMRTIVDAFSQYERALIRARTKSAMAAARAKGRRIGHIPFGMAVTDDQRHLQPNPQEQYLLAEMRAMRADGVTVREIARRLNESGHRTRRGNLWYHQSIVQLLDAHPGDVT